MDSEFEIQFISITCLFFPHYCELVDFLPWPIKLENQMTALSSFGCSCGEFMHVSLSREARWLNMSCILTTK